MLSLCLNIWVVLKCIELVTDCLARWVLNMDHFQSMYIVTFGEFFKRTSENWEKNSADCPNTLFSFLFFTRITPSQTSKLLSFFLKSVPLSLTKMYIICSLRMIWFKPGSQSVTTEVWEEGRLVKKSLPPIVETKHSLMKNPSWLLNEKS